MTREKAAKMEQMAAKASLSQMDLIWIRFRKNKLAVIGLIGIVIMMAICFTSPLYISWEKVIHQDLLLETVPPNKEFWFGTDQYGRDLFARILRGGVYSLSSGSYSSFCKVNRYSLFLSERGMVSSVTKFPLHLDNRSIGLVKPMI